jgi:hypothetical protein
MLENKSDVEKNASEQKCCGKVPVQNMDGVILDIDDSSGFYVHLAGRGCEIPCESAD